MKFTNVKKWLAMLLAVCSMLSLVACGKSDKDSAGDDSEKGTKVAVVFASSGLGDKSFNDALYDLSLIHIFYYPPSYSLLTVSPVLSREPTCDHHYVEYTCQQYDLQEVPVSLTSIAAAVIKKQRNAVWPVSGWMIWRSFMLGIRARRYIGAKCEYRKYL